MSEESAGRAAGSGVSRRGALGQIAWGVAAASGAAVASWENAAAQDATPAAAAVPPDFRVVLHAAEEQNWPYVLSNLRNLTQEWPQAHLRVVVDGSAVLNLQGENSVTNELTKVVDAGVELYVCPNALHEHQIAPSTIPSYARTDLGGVVALVLAYREGFHYVKP
jgi:intracellular sulfur oxidation DsrE/DsrF family protein